MVAVGYATLPIIPSLEGIAAKLSSALEKPAAAAAQRASASIEQSMSQAADKASYVLKKAREREEEATQKVRDLERKLETERNDAARKHDAIQAAEMARDRQVADSKARVADAQRKLDEAKSSGAATTEELADLERKLESASLSAAETKIKAENRVSAAVDAHQKSLDKVEKTTRDYGDAQEDAAESSEKVLTAQKRLDTQTSMTTGEFKAQQDEAEKLARELSGIGDAAADAGEKSVSLGDRIKQGLGTIGRGALLGVGAKIGTTFMDAVGESVGRGFKRLNAFDQAEASMRGLGHSADAIDRIMQGVNDSVTGTSFGLDEAAGSGAKLSAVGVEVGAELDRALKLTADIAAQGRTSMDDISSVMAKVAGDGILTNEVLGQLDDRATGASAAVARHMGVSVGEVKKLVTEGKVSFEDFQTAMEDHIGGAAQATGETFEGSLGNMQSALGRLGAKIQEPVFALLPGVFTAVGGAVDKLGEKVGPLVEEWSARLQPTMEQWADELGPRLIDTIEQVADKIGTAFEWISDNQDVLQAVAVGAVAAGVAWQGWAVAMKVHAAAVAIADKGWKAYIASTKIATAVTAAFDKVTKATVIGAIAVAVMAVVAALVYFFTKTETGKEIWSRFTDFLKSAWESVQEKFTVVVDSITAAWEWLTSAIQAGYEGYIKPVVDGIILVFKTLFVVITTVVLTPLQIAWNAVWAGISWYWENVSKPAFDAIQSVFHVVAEWIREKIDVIRGKFDEFTAKIVELYETYVAPYLLLVQAAFEYAQAWIAERIDLIRGVLQALGDKITELYSSYVQPIIDKIVERFNHFRDMVGQVKDFIVDVAIAGMRSAFNGFRDFVTSVVDGVGTKFSEIRQKFAKPINFVIRTVYTDGLQRVWNGIAEKVGGVPQLGNIAPIPEFNTGGQVKGPGTGTSDDILARLSNGEHVFTAAEVEAVGGHGVIYALRKAINAGRGFTFANGQLIELPGRINNRVGDLAGAAPGLFPAFRDGGEVRPMWEMQLQKAHKFAESQHGKPYQWAGPTGPGSSFDCSGFMGSIAAVIQGTDQWRRYWATMSFPTPGAQGFAPGLGPGFSIGVWNGGPYGGHTSGTLGPAGPYGSVNVESGGSPSMVKYGVGAVGADDPQHKMHFHLPIGADGSFVSGGSLSAEGMLSVIRQKIESTMDSVLGPIRAQLPQPPTGINAIPHQIVEDLPPKVVDKLFNIVENLGEKLATVYNAVKDVGSLVSDRVSSGVNWVTDRAASAIGLHDEGGWLMPGQLATNRLSKPEPVLTPEQWADISRMVESLPTIGPPLKDLVEVLEVEARTPWDERMASLANHLEGIEVNPKGETEKTRGRIGTPGEIAQWAGAEIAESVGNEALGLIGLDGLISLPRFLDDELRVPYTKEQTTAPGEAEMLVEPKSVASVADQATAGQAQSVTLNVTFNNVDPENVDELQRMVDELATKVSDATTSRRTAAAVSRGRSI